MRKKKHFTIIELTLSISLILLASSLIGWNIHKLVSNHRIHKSAKQLMSMMRNCQILALTHRADLELHIIKNRDTFTFRWQSDEPQLSSGPNQVKKIEGISEIVFNGEAILKDLKLRIYSSGRIEPLGRLGLFSALHKEGLWIDFSQPLYIKGA